jgi:hypothetical protein
MSKDLEDGSLGLLQGNSKAALTEKEDGQLIEIRDGIFPDYKYQFLPLYKPATSIRSYNNFK